MGIRDKSNIFKCFLASVFISIILIAIPFSTKAAVTLKYFHATYIGGKVSFEWETGSEQNSAGFMINRSAEENGTYIQIPEEDPAFFIALGEGGEYTGEYYNNDGDLVTFYDEDVVEGMTYWYRLESIDNTNNSDYSEPVAVYIGATPTPTFTPSATFTDEATATITLTRKPTKTKKPGTPTPTFTATRYSWTAPTATPQPPSNNTPQGDLNATAAAQTNEASQLNVTPEIEGTATLVPLPSIAIIFPTAIAKQPDVKSDNMTNNPNTRGNNSDSWLTPQRMVMVVIIIAIWVMLGGWFFLSFKRLEK